ncbi:hypothetical protein B0T17DRAFT_519623 [Bombardia bombarda]|uniref:Uncharacterized protein n=1 Tax=Bombardia bombarda TaxID=252184 RepID=A0AA39XMA6_9PEZI|nr:hypothetical protein B0T17DRAFT_519623 [Bombardia bombarda]
MGDVAHHLPSKPIPTLEGLPNETLKSIITELLLKEEKLATVAALAQASRRLHSAAAPELYEHVSRVNLTAGEDALVWAAENNEPTTLKALLIRGVNPDARFYSAIPDFYRQEVLDKQRLASPERRLVPKFDHHLLAKLAETGLVQHYSRMVMCPLQQLGQGSKTEATRLALEGIYTCCLQGQLPQKLNINRWTYGWRHDDPEEVEVRKLLDPIFGCDHSDQYNKMCNFSWTPLHVAIRRQHANIISLLLDYGANIRASSKGACDCRLPEIRLSGFRQQVTQYQDPYYREYDSMPVWTPLHCAVCSGNYHITRMLLRRGANFRSVGGVDSIWFNQLPGSTNLVSYSDSVTAFHTAALVGNVSMCQMLFDYCTSIAQEPQLDAVDTQKRTAFDYAVAAGHVRTTGKWLLDNGANPLPGLKHHGWVMQTNRHALTHAISAHMRKPRTVPVRVFPPPIHFLCLYGLFEDALFLLNYMESRVINEIMTAQLYIWVLRVCFYTEGGIIQIAPQGSQRGFQHQILTDMCLPVASEKHILASWAGRPEPPALAPFVKRLLELGADPNDLSEVCSVSPLHMAVELGYLNTMRALLAGGADVNLKTRTKKTRPIHCLTWKPLSSRHELEICVELVACGASLPEPQPRSIRQPIFPITPDDGAVTLFLELLLTRKKRDFCSFIQHDSFGHDLSWLDAESVEVWHRLMQSLALRYAGNHIPTSWARFLPFIAGLAPGGEYFYQWVVEKYGLSPYMADIQTGLFSVEQSKTILEAWAEKQAADNPEALVRFLDFGMPSDIREMIKARPTSQNIELNACTASLGDMSSLLDPYKFILNGHMRSAKILLDRGLHEFPPKTWLKDEKTFFDLLQLITNNSDRPGSAEVVDALLTSYSRVNGPLKSSKASNRKLKSIAGALVAQHSEEVQYIKVDAVYIRVSAQVETHGRRATGVIKLPKFSELTALLNLAMKHTINFVLIGGRKHRAQNCPLAIAIKDRNTEVMEIILKTTRPFENDTQDLAWKYIEWTMFNLYGKNTTLDREVGIRSAAALKTLLHHMPHVDFNRVVVVRRKIDLFRDADYVATPLQWVLDTFLFRHVVKPGGDYEGISECAGAIQLDDTDLLDSVCALIQHGASWTMACNPEEPDKTALRSLVNLLEATQCFTQLAFHNLRKLQAHVKLDCRLVVHAQEDLAPTFNPIEYGDVKARWV